MAKKERPNAREFFYGTKQVAEILEIPEWRVKNFSEGDAYGLPSSQQVGSGRGSRRLYDLGDVLRLAIASELVNCGFTPETTGRAIREIPESVLTTRPHEFYAAARGHIPLLVLNEGNWRVRQLPEVMKLLTDALGYAGNQRGVFVLNFPTLLTAVRQRIERFAENQNREARRS